MSAASAIPKIYNWAKADGAFKRQVSQFRDWISREPGSKFSPEKDRYHLYVSYACPWAHRTLIVRALKGLESIIPISVVNSFLGPNGWKFSTDAECPGAIPDFVNNAEYLSDIYYKADAGYTARFTVPVLWDKKLNTIVSNESAEIIRMFNREFNDLIEEEYKKIDLYPAELQHEIDETNSWVYDTINNGVYKAGFATKQEPYEKACRDVFTSLDRVESILSSSNYLVGSQLTEADVRLFTTIVRFDPVYHGHFKCNLGTISANYPSILKWLRRIYKIPLISKTVNMVHIKHHYYESHKQINPTGVVALWDGPDLEIE